MALGNIVLDDFLDPLPVKEKRSKKKSKSDNLTVSPELSVEHKTHKKKKKEKKKRSTSAKEDVDLLGLEQPEMVTNGQKEEVTDASSLQWNWSGESFSLGLMLASCRVEAEDGIFSLSCELCSGIGRERAFHLASCLPAVELRQRMASSHSPVNSAVELVGRELFTWPHACQL